MKRSLVLALIVAALVSGITLGLHISGVTLRIELAISGLLSGSGTASRVVSEKLQGLVVFAVALGVAWAFMMTSSRKKMALLVPVLVVELLALTWVCTLFATFFQPLPGILSSLLSLGGAAGLVSFLDWRATRPAKVFEDRLSAKQIERITTGELPVQVVEPRAYEVTAVVCDIGNKYDLSEELEPAPFGQTTTDFIARATKAFLDAGAYIESAAGEGVVAIFGYPVESETHADKATRVAMRLVDELAPSSSNGETPTAPQLQLHAGVSSGRIVVTPFRNEERTGTIAVGEPIELARRFCIANRFYGSRVLIGPRTFELAGQSLVARPIDFLSGVDVRERHEIYEPISLAENATDEAIRRRDSFWNGVVLYREKRWAEAYAHFQRARSPENDNDPPLNLYLRRLEPLALQLTNTPLDE